jgi:hypothetical protein
MLIWSSDRHRRGGPRRRGFSLDGGRGVGSRSLQSEAASESIARESTQEAVRYQGQGRVHESCGGLRPDDCIARAWRDLPCRRASLGRAQGVRPAAFGSSRSGLRIPRVGRYRRSRCRAIGQWRDGYRRRRSANARTSAARHDSAIRPSRLRPHTMSPSTNGFSASYSARLLRRWSPSRWTEASARST